MAIEYSVKKHTDVRMGYAISQDYGEHMVSLKIDEATDNGRIVKVGKMVSLDQYEIDTDAVSVEGYIFDKEASSGLWLVVFTKVPDDLTAMIYQKPLIEEESPRILTSLGNFYNDPEDGPVRGYILHALDRWYLSDKGFGGVAPQKGCTFTSVVDGKPVLVAPQS